MKFDKTLVSLIIVAVVVSVFAVKVNLFSDDFYNRIVTGFAAGNQSTGKINLTIESGLIINFTTDVIDWGSGRVTAGAANATLDTSRNATYKVINGNWTGWYGNKSRGFILENIGNLNTTIWLKTGKNSTQFIGGSNPAYQFNITNNGTNSCTNASGFNLGAYYDANTTSISGTKICDVFDTRTGSDTIQIDILLRIPADSLTGDLEDTITATAYAA